MAENTTLHIIDIGNVGIFTDNANWVQDLAYSWNAGLYDYAYGGATCDNSVEQYVQVPSVSEQVSNYIEHGQGKNMNSAESVYALFIGINDANIFNGNVTALYTILNIYQLIRHLILFSV